jgi:hypothetical protein
VEVDVDIQCFLAFVEFLETHKVPLGLSKRERGFYRRTIERMTDHSLMPKSVLEQFDRNYSLEDSTKSGANFRILRVF